MTRRPLLPAFFAALLLGAAMPAAAQDTGQERAQRYATCLGLAESASAFAYNEARLWREEGEDWRARHCGGLALLLLDRPGEAAPWLSEARRLAGRAGEEPAVRAALAALEGQAWALAGETDKALEAQGVALTLAPNQADYRVDRAFTLAGTGENWAALDDLNAAHDLAPGRADILALRASLYRRLEVPELALENAEEALGLAPDLPEGLLERALAAGALGDLAQARADLDRLLTVAPDSAAAAEAERFLREIN